MLTKSTLALGAASLGLVATSAFGATFFNDVPTSSWFYNSVQWANQNAIMTGPSNMPGKFDPDGVVNRAQLATVLARYHEFTDENVNDLQVRLSLLEDAWEDEFGPLNNRSSSSRSSARASSSSLPSDWFSASLTGGQETPPVTTNAAGQGTFQLRGDDLQYDITVSGLSGPITGAHFHLGAPGVAGDVVEPITFDGNRASAIWTNLSQLEITNLVTGRYYVNIHTAAHPNGEIRGQITWNNSGGSFSSYSSSSRSSSSLSSSSMSSSSMSSSSLGL